MRKIFFFAGVCLATSMNAQLYTPLGSIAGTTTSPKSGNVGVNTNSPTSKLTVYDSGLAGTYQFELKTNHVRNPETYFMKNTVWGSGSEDIVFSLRHDGQMFVGGSVGIGKLPSQTLDVNGNIAGLDLISGGANSWILHTPDDNRKTIHFAPRNAGNTDWDWSKATVINGENGNMLVSNKIEAREVKVTSSPTADFVFETDYDLPKLEDIEKHIKDKKHLPEIASAKQMEKEGVNIGEFQIKLLQKIEELTLYSIEQNKQLKKLQEENKILKSQSEEIQLLKKQISTIISKQK